MVPLRARHDAEALRRVLETIATSSDTPPRPAQPVPSTLSFDYGEAGVETDIDASMSDVVAALYRPTAREAHLTLRPVPPTRPDITLLGRLIVNYIEERAFSGVASIFILDLTTGEEVRIDADVAMSGMDLLKVPITVEAYRVLDVAPSVTQARYITETLLAEEPDGAKALLKVIAGKDNPYVGAQLTTETMWQLGLKNTFIATPYGESALEGTRTTYETPANSARSRRTEPDLAIQTTAEDMGALLAMLYYCAETGGGALRAAFPDQITQQECRHVLEVMQENHIGSLIEEGVPADVSVSHRHGWIGDTHADAGIVFSPGGAYVLVQFFYQHDWLPWERSSPMMADISRATYNYFNFDDPYLDSSRAN